MVVHAVLPVKDYAGRKIVIPSSYKNSWKSIDYQSQTITKAMLLQKSTDSKNKAYGFKIGISFENIASVVTILLTNYR